MSAMDQELGQLRGLLDRLQNMLDHENTMHAITQLERNDANAKLRQVELVTDGRFNEVEGEPCTEAIYVGKVWSSRKIAMRVAEQRKARIAELEVLLDDNSIEMLVDAIGEALGVDAGTCEDSTFQNALSAAEAVFIARSNEHQQHERGDSVPVRVSGLGDPMGNVKEVTGSLLLLIGEHPEHAAVAQGAVDLLDRMAEALARERGALASSEWALSFLAEGLDHMDVPREDETGELSLFGRILEYGQMQEEKHLDTEASE